MRVLVCGGRDFTDINLFAGAMNEHIPDELRDDLVIIQGGARGADELAKDWAFRHEVSCKEFPADWKTHGKAAGPIRNQVMLDEGKPDLVLAFPGGRGTADMVNRARQANVEVREIS